MEEFFKHFETSNAQEREEIANKLKEIMEYIEGQFTTDADPVGEYVYKGEYADYDIKVKKNGNLEIEICI